MALSPSSRPRINVRVSPRFPGRIVGQTGIKVQTGGGIATVRLAIDELTENNSSDLAGRSILSYDAGSGEHERIPAQNFVDMVRDDIEPEILAKSVRWDVAQSLTALQQLRARDNIGIAASAIPFEPTGGVAATDVQAAIAEVDAGLTVAITELQDDIAGLNVAVGGLNTAVAQLNSEKQPLADNLSALAALTLAADKLPYATGPASLALTDISSFARSLLAGADAADIMSALGFSFSLGSNGYVRFPNGLLIQWGSQGGGFGLVDTYYPTVFPENQVWSIITTVVGSTGNTVTANVYDRNSTYFRAYRRYNTGSGTGDAGETFFYVAIGR